MLKELRVGLIVNTHGLKGEVKVQICTEDAERFYDIDQLMLREEKRVLRGNARESEGVVLEIESVRFHKNMALLKFSGVDSIEEAEKLRNYGLYVDRKDAIELGEGEYFIGDYYDLRVLLEDDTELGIVRDVIETGANLVFVCKTNEGKEVLIPKAPNVILDLKPEEGYMRIHLLEGLLDL